MTTTAVRTCPLCEATCGLRLQLDGERVVSVRGDDQDVFSGGYLCPKGATFGELEADPDRLTRPRVRRGGELVEVGWDEAYDEVARRLSPLIEEHGRDAVALYLGNPNVHNLAGQLYVRPLAKALGTRNIHSASSVDQLPKHVSSGAMFGDPLAIGVPDIDRTRLLVILGGNPRVSNGSLWTAPDLPGRLTDLQRRGGRLVVVDPRRTRTAARADEHLAVVPGSDALLLAAIVHTLDDEDLVDVGDHLRPHVAGLEEVCQAVQAFSPERVAPACGVDAGRIRGLARELAATPQAVVYGRLGTTTVRHGTLASWLVDVVNVLIGGLDQPGGAMFPTPAHHRPARRPFRWARWHSRVRGLPEAIGELPVATLIDEIETPGQGQVRALVTVAGNPVISTPDAARLDTAIAGLDLVVAVDFHVNATTRHADVILPPPGALRRPHYDLAFSGLAVRNVANFSPPVLDPDPEQPEEWEILLTLASIALGQEPDVTVAEEFVLRSAVDAVVSDPGARLADRDPEQVLAALGGEAGPERLLDLLLRTGPYGDGFGSHPDGLSLQTLREHPHGVDLGPLVPRVPEILSTASGRIELAPPALVEHLPALEAELDHREPDGLVLIGRRHLRTNNSWSHNVAGLAKGQQLCTLQIHPSDAASRGLSEGGLARVRSSAGELDAVVECADDLRPGVVSLPHGFGHDLDGVELEVARRQPGVNTNILTDRHEVDPISGTAVLNGIPVEITAG